MIQGLVISFAIQKSNGSHSAIVAFIAPFVKRIGGIRSESWVVGIHVFWRGKLRWNLGGSGRQVGFHTVSLLIHWASIDSRGWKQLPCLLF